MNTDHMGAIMAGWTTITRGDRNAPDEYRKVTRVIDRVDYGPWGEDAHGDKSEPSATCPHCGAHGRYVWHFVTDDGMEHGAMEGCMQVWPGGKAAQAHYYKVQERRKRVSEDAKDLLAYYTDDMEVSDVVTDDFARDVLDKGARYGFSVRQAAAVRNALQRAEAYRRERAAVAASGVIVPNGDAIAIEGVIISVKYREDYDRWTMTVELSDGARVWGTMPTAIAGTDPGSRMGRRVRFVANVTAAHDNPAFGFYKRPRKAEFIEG